VADPLASERWKISFVIASAPSNMVRTAAACKEISGGMVWKTEEKPIQCVGTEGVWPESAVERSRVFFARVE
jgi:hypothetical protein